MSVLYSSSGGRSDPRGERAVVCRRDARRGGCAAQVPQEDVAPREGCRQSASRVYGVRRTGSGAQVSALFLGSVEQLLLKS